MSYRIEWMPAAAGLALIALLFVPYLGLLIALALLMLAAATLVALAGALVASPILLVRAVRRRAEQPVEAVGHARAQEAELA
jgi:hypothetical protein